jgi:hypothetical protein
MKKIFNLRLIATLLVGIATLVASSCQTQPDDDVTIEGYSEIECKAGDKPQFTFTAGGSWQLSSDKMWCTFITPAGNQMEMAGAAGTHPITLSISDKNISNSVTTANITIKVGDKSAIIAVVKRDPKEQIIYIENAIESRTNTFELGYVDWKEFRIKANFRFTATEIPEWVEIAYKGEDGNYHISNSITGSGSGTDENALVGYARIVNDGTRECHKITAEDGYEIVIVDESGNKEFRFPVTYDGMGKDKLTFRGPTERTYGWEVSLDGKTFRHYDESDDTTTTFSDELKYEITAEDNDYEVLYFEQYLERGISSYEHIGEGSSKQWISFDKEAMTLRINEHTGKPRYGVVMALPRGIYENIKSDVYSIFEEDSSAGIALPAIMSDYERYILIDFVQHDLEEKSAYEGMYIYHSLTTWEIPATRITNAELTEKYGTTEIFEAPFVNSVQGKRPGIIIDPRIEEWTTLTAEEGRATAEVWHGDTQLKISDNEYYLGENMDEVMSLHLWGPQAEFSENVVVVFKLDGMVRKLLVVTPPAK